MVYSESLAERVRLALGARAGLTEKRMFGGIGFLLHGNLCVCVWQQMLIARLGLTQAEPALQREHVREFDVTGRPMKGWVMIEPDGLESARQLDEWLQLALAFVVTLPRK